MPAPPAPVPQRPQTTRKFFAWRLPLNPHPKPENFPSLTRSRRRLQITSSGGREADHRNLAVGALRVLAVLRRDRGDFRIRGFTFGALELQRPRAQLAIAGPRATLCPAAWPDY